LKLISYLACDQVSHQLDNGQNCNSVCDILKLISYTVQLPVHDQVCELAM